LQGKLPDEAERVSGLSINYPGYRGQLKEEQKPRPTTRIQENKPSPLGVGRERAGLRTPFLPNCANQTFGVVSATDEIKSKPQGEDKQMQLTSQF